MDDPKKAAGEDSTQYAEYRKWSKCRVANGAIATSSDGLRRDNLKMFAVWPSYLIAVHNTYAEGIAIAGP